MAANYQKPKIVLALGGGGARGFAHIGVLQVLEEAGIEIWGIVGTSMGALIGSTFAAGSDLYYLERLLEYISWEEIIDIGLPRLGLINGNKIQIIIDLLTKGKNFEELAIPFWAVATDLQTGEAIIFKKGPLATAVRASISMPGVFTPVIIEGQYLVDGAVAAGIPVEIARQMEPDLIIAINVGFIHTQHQINNIFDVLSKVVDIGGNRLDQRQIELADIVIRPQLGPIGVLHFHQASKCVEIGRRAAESSLQEIKERMKQFREDPAGSKKPWSR